MLPAIDVYMIMQCNRYLPIQFWGTCGPSFGTGRGHILFTIRSQQQPVIALMDLNLRTFTLVPLLDKCIPTIINGQLKKLDFRMVSRYVNSVLNVFRYTLCLRISFPELTWSGVQATDSTIMSRPIGNRDDAVAACLINKFMWRGPGSKLNVKIHFVLRCGSAILITI